MTPLIQRRQRVVDIANPFTMPLGYVVERRAIVPAAYVALDAASGDVVLEAVQPSAATAAAYGRRLRELIRDMHDEVVTAVVRAYKRNAPVIAEDATPADALNDVLSEMFTKWCRRFGTESKRIAEEFVAAAAKGSDRKLVAALKKGGIPSVKLKLTAQQRDVLRAAVHENVSLITDLPQKYMTAVEGAVMRSVSKGGDEKVLVKTLREQYGMTQERAVTISRDQNRKAVNALQRSRQLELGVKESVWMHSSAGKVPRVSHKKNNGKRYDTRKGWYDPTVKKYVQPGELINCRCTSRAVIPGFI